MQMETPVLLHEVQGENVLLREVLRREMQISATLLKRLKANQGIFCNNQPCHVRHSCQRGDVVKVVLTTAEAMQPHVLPQQGPLDVLYADAYLLAVNKPAGLPMHPTAGYAQDTLANYYAAYAQQRGWDAAMRALTRLDRNTSGVVLLARNAYTAEALRRGMGQMQKHYLALVHGHVAAAGEIDAPIGQPIAGRLQRAVCPTGKPARTCYTPICTNGRYTLVHVQPQNGRTHQIRVHFSHVGHPLVGDFLYGQEEPALLGRHALHCAALCLPHPHQELPLTLFAPLAEDLQKLCTQLFACTGFNATDMLQWEKVREVSHDRTDSTLERTDSQDFG